VEAHEVEGLYGIVDNFLILVGEQGWTGALAVLEAARNDPFGEGEGEGGSPGER
jgi:hypothetical protein